MSTRTDTVNGRIRRARLLADLDQGEAAKALGVSRNTISRWETGAALPDIITAARIAELYGVEVGDLVYADRGGLAKSGQGTQLITGVSAGSNPAPPTGGRTLLGRAVRADHLCHGAPVRSFRPRSAQ